MAPQIWVDFGAGNSVFSETSHYLISNDYICLVRFIDILTNMLGTILYNAWLGVREVLQNDLMTYVSCGWTGKQCHSSLIGWYDGWYVCLVRKKERERERERGGEGGAEHKWCAEVDEDNDGDSDGLLFYWNLFGSLLLNEYVLCRS